MKLYKIPHAAPGHRWLSHRTGLREFETVETPREGRQGMADFLNANELEVMPKDGPEPGPDFVNEDNNSERDILHEAEQRAVAAARTTQSAKTEQVQRSWDRNDIEDFILNRATVSDVESIFTCLGTRFKELANASEAAK